MLKSKKAKFFITFLAVSLLSSIMTFLPGCNLNIANEKSNEYFIYMVMKTEIEGYITLRGLTDAGKELEYIVIPDEIEGYPVRVINGGATAHNLKKIYVSKNVRTISDRWLKNGDAGYKVLFCRYDCTNSSIGDWSTLNLFAPNIAAENYERCITCSHIANINYLYHYEDSVNGGVHFIDDLEAGENISVIPPEPTREGYRFMDWYINEECTEVFDTANYIRNEEDGIINLYAGWEAK
jgi:hypothetical protein